MMKRIGSELKPYGVPEPFGCTAMRYHGKEETEAEKFWIGRSIFLPGGGAEGAYEDNPPNEGRSLKNENNEAAEMLVIINYPDTKWTLADRI